MWLILVGFASSFAAGGILVWYARRDHYANLDAFEFIAQKMTREYRARMRRDLKIVRRSRRAGTMDDVVWVRELQEERR
jgi:hypothetical protein